MVKYFCDRCGKEIESLDSVFIEVIDINRDFFHLCKDCYDELIRWRKAKENDIITCEKCCHRTITIMDHKGENVRYVCGLYHGTNSPQFYCADGDRELQTERR